MTQFATVARPYAKALFDLASKENRLEFWSDGLKVLANAVVGSERLAAFIDEPELQLHQKVDGMLSLLEPEQLDEPLKNLINILASNKRLLALPEIYAQYQELILAGRNTKVVVIHSAYPLSGQQLGEVADVLAAKFGAHLEVAQVVSPELIGGIKVELGDQILDLSVQARLQSLYAAMMN